MLWYGDTVEGGAEPNEFGASGAALLPTTTCGEGSLDFAEDSVNITGGKFRAINFANIHSEISSTT